MKKQVKKYLKKHKIAPSKLADLAGVKRWSVVRFVNFKDTDITLKTYEKLSLYMMQHP